MSVSERRREGYPPEGPRPRSGLGRVARSRSDAPRLTLPLRTPVSIFGTIAIIHTRTADGIVTFGGIGVTVGWRDARLTSGRA